MINPSDFYHVMTVLVPLYVAMVLAYASVKWWKIFTPDQCSGINRFVALFLVPLLSFHFISTNNPYAMKFKFIAADTLQKIIVLSILAVWCKFSKKGSLEWTITLFSLTCVPSALVLGIPLLKAMYGDFTESLVVQIVVLQCIMWYTLVLFMYEYGGAKILIFNQFPDNAAESIVSIDVDSDVLSLDGRQSLETESVHSLDGKLHVTVRRSNVSSCDLLSTNTPRPSNLTNTKIYSVESSRNPSTRGSSFNQTDFYSIEVSGRNSSVSANDVHRFSTSRRPSNYDDEDDDATKKTNMFRLFHSQSVAPEEIAQQQHIQENYTNATEKVNSQDGRKDVDNLNQDEGNNNIGGDTHGKAMPPTSVMTRLILIMVWRKLIRNPNTYSSLIGLVWSLISFRWQVEMPAIIAQSISILSNAGLGMAMFSIGLSMALQPRIIACGYSLAAFSMALRFLAGPALMTVASIVVGLRGTLLRVAILQAALPQAIVSFVFAKEYNVHTDILSTSVIFGTLIAMPITLVYYIILGT